MQKYKKSFYLTNFFQYFPNLKKGYPYYFRFSGIDSYSISGFVQQFLIGLKFG